MPPEPLARASSQDRAELPAGTRPRARAAVYQASCRSGAISPTAAAGRKPGSRSRALPGLAMGRCVPMRRVNFETSPSIPYSERRRGPKKLATHSAWVLPHLYVQQPRKSANSSSVSTRSFASGEEASRASAAAIYIDCVRQEQRPPLTVAANPKFGLVLRPNNFLFVLRTGLAVHAGF